MYVIMHTVFTPGHPMTDIVSGSFIWDEDKEKTNIVRHELRFLDATKVFFDPNCIILEDQRHSENEERYYCIGKLDGNIATVRFTFRMGRIRIIGAGYWTKWRILYEEKISLG
jgi:uncharacterized DUF497 family protein